MLTGNSGFGAVARAGGRALALLLCWCLFGMAGLLAIPGSIAPVLAQTNCPAEPAGQPNDALIANADAPSCSYIVASLGSINNGIEIFNSLSGSGIGILPIRNGGTFLIPASNVTCTGSGCGGTSVQGARRFQSCDTSGSNSCLINIRYTDNNSQTVSASFNIAASATTLPAFTILGGGFGGTPPPTVTGVSPNAGPTAGGTVVTITGRDFTGVTAVTVGGTPATSVVFNSATSITATTSPRAAGAASVEVTTPAGSSLPNTLFTYDDTAPTVQIFDAPATTDGITPFQVRFEFSENVVNFDAIGDITLGNATASNFVAVDGDTYTATITPTGAGDITIDVAAGVAQDAANNGNTAATQVVVRSTVVEETQRVIANFMRNRATHMLNNQPDIGGFIDGTANNGGGPLGDLSLNGNDEGLTLAFSSSLSRVQNEIDKRLMAALAPEADQRVAQAHVDKNPAQSGSSYGMALGNEQTLPESDETYAADAGPFHGSGGSQRRFDVWTAIHGANANAGSSESSFWVGYFGAHYFVSPDLLVGALAQIDWADETDSAANSNADGLGWMIGPYMAARLGGQNLFMEARAAWGRSQNDVSPLGTYTDEFETSRWLARGRIYGRYNFGEVTVEPSVAVTYFEETQESYTDSLANTIPQQTISQGELRFGPSFERMIALGDGAYLTPKFGVTGVYNFGISNGASSQGFALGDEVLRARVDGGLAFVNALGWSLLLEAYFDGIGADDYDAWGGKARLTIPVH